MFLVTLEHKARMQEEQLSIHCCCILSVNEPAISTVVEGAADPVMHAAAHHCSALLILCMQWPLPQHNKCIVLQVEPQSKEIKV